MSTTGERIKARRKQLSISADELAERVGVSRSTVFRWEKGDVEKIPAVELNKIAHALQTTDAYLFGAIDDPEWTGPVVKENEQNGYKTVTIFNDDVRSFAVNLDKLPKKDREKAIAVVTMMFDKYANLFEGIDDSDDT